jgi:hypothetical protein
MSGIPLAANIADGYHRVSPAYRPNPFGDVPLRVARELRQK